MVEETDSTGKRKSKFEKCRFILYSEEYRAVELAAHGSLSLLHQGYFKGAKLAFVYDTAEESDTAEKITSVTPRCT